MYIYIYYIRLGNNLGYIYIHTYILINLKRSSEKLKTIIIKNKTAKF